MKRKIVVLLGVMVGAILLSSALLTTTPLTREQVLARLIYQGLEELHYSESKIDDEFSGKAFAVLLDILDSNKHFLLTEDVDKLRQYQDKIDDQFAEGSTELITLSAELLQKRIEQVKAFSQDILSKPFDFSLDETFQTDVDKRTFCTSSEELKAMWSKILKYNAMIRYINLQKSKGKEKSAKELEELARKDVQKSFQTNFSNLSQGNKNDALSRFFNALIGAYDPHSIYFAPKDKQDFDMEMSGTFEGIGALLGEKDGFVNVARIIPGGPSWRQKQLQAGDVILKVGQGDEEPVDVVGMRLVDAVKLIRGKKGTLVRLSIKKPDGQLPVISIVRDVVVLEDTFARSAVLTPEETGKTFGYIYLPGFYSDFTKPDGRNATDDVRIELEKLKRKNVAAIILDLRDNSGGALQEAIRMSGLFIKEGPVVQVKDKHNQPRVYRDPDPGIVYSGPVIVLINALSASAAEILTAALQDYNRAIIVGGAHSFGKGTVQVMLNLDQYLLSRAESYKPLGALTITIQKFYRVNGTAIQLKGVTPDIILPDYYDYLELGEQYYDNPLDWDSVPALTFQAWTNQRPDYGKLVEKSRQRVQQGERFKYLQNYIAKLKEMRGNTLQSLNLEKMMADQEKIRTETEQFTKSQQQALPIKVLPAAEFDPTLSPALKQEAKTRQDEWFTQLQKDLILDETLRILGDLIDLLPKPPR